MNLFRTLLARRTANRRRPTRAQVGVEAMESRVVLSTITVTSLADDGSIGTLRSAFARSNFDSGPSTIVFAPSLAGQTIKPAGALPPLHNAQGVTIEGPSGAPVKIDLSLSNLYNYSGSSDGLIVEPGANVTVQGLELDNSPGRGVQNDGTLDLNGVTISGCAGGAVNNGTMTVENGTFANNKANDGGGILNAAGTLSITGSTLTGNSAGSGGALYISAGTVQASSTEFNQNQAQGKGGGVFVGDGTFSDSGDSYIGNVAVSDGGGLYTTTGSLVTLQADLMSMNYGYEGGGWYSNSGPITSSQMTYQDNSGEVWGAVFENYYYLPLPSGGGSGGGSGGLMM